MKKTWFASILAASTLVASFLATPTPKMAQAAGSDIPLHHENIVKITTGAASVTYALGESGNVYAWGKNGGNYPFLNDLESQFATYNLPQDITPKITPSLQTNEKIVDISVNPTSGVVAVTSNGRVLYWGRNDSYEIGPIIKDYYLTRTVISVWPTLSFPNGSKARYVETSGTATAVLSADRKTIYTIGYGPSVGNNIAYTDFETFQSTPVNITARFSLGTDTIDSLTGGNFNGFVAVTSSGKIWVWGWNNDVFPQLGLLDSAGNGYDAKVPTLLNTQAGFPTLNANERFIKGVASTRHTMIYTNQGRVFGHGYHNNGELGIGTVTLGNNHSNTFRLATTIAGGIKDIAVGQSHSTLLSNDNKVYTTGDDTYFQLGNSTPTADVKSFTEITSQFDFPSTPTLSHVYAGANINYLVNSDGKVFSWGDNRGGLLGLGVNELTIDRPVALFSQPANDVQAKINALPNPVTLADKTAVQAARSAYNSLDFSSKELITNIALLVEAEIKLVELTIAALPSSSNLTLSDETAVVAARAAYDALSTSQKSGVDNSADLLTAEAKILELKNRAAALVVDNQILAISQPITVASKTAVEAARAAYTALTTTQKGYVEQLPLLEQLEASLKSALDQAAANSAMSLITGLPNPATLADEASVTAARAAYNALTADQKALITNLTTLTDAEAQISTLLKDVNDVKALITNLPSPIDVDDEAAIEAARAAYDALDESLKSRVTNLGDLESAEADFVTAQAEVLAVINQIDGLPNPVLFTDEATVEAVRALYDSLTPAQQALVTNFTSLKTAEDTIQGYYDEIDAIKNGIAQLPVPVTLVNESAVLALWLSYNGLTEEQQALVTNFNVLENADTTLANLYLEIERVKSLIEALPTNDSLAIADKVAVQEARDAFDLLTPEQQALVNNMTSLTAAETIVQELINEVELVLSMINDLPNPVTFDDEADVVAIGSLYAQLTPEQQGLITNYQTFTTAEDTLFTLWVEVNDVLELINGLPTVPNVALTDEEIILAARAAFDLLTPLQQAKITNLKALENDEARLAELKEIQTVENLIEALPSPMTLEAELALEEAWDAYNGLTTSLQSEVENYPKLLNAQSELDFLHTVDTLSNLPSIDEFTELYRDEETREQAEALLTNALARYNRLTAAQKAALDPALVELLESLQTRYDNLNSPSFDWIWLLPLHILSGLFFVWIKRRKLKELVNLR